MISRYQILRKIGSGGMGDVYEAEDTRLGRHVALKFLPDRLADDPQAQERFELEARAASALNHPNICTIYEINEAEGKSFIAMELLDGETLRNRLSGRPLGMNLLLEVAIQIASALDVAHASGVVHRDIKPENIFLTRTSHVKVLDFGVAKMASERRHAVEAVAAQPTMALSPQLTASGVVVGTTCYMSPEQIRGEQLDARSDLFSFGAVLYEMGTGKRAFPGNTIGLMCDAVLNRQPEPLTEVNPQLPMRLQEIIEKALEKDVQVRYQSAADMRADLVRLRRMLDSDSKGTTSGKIAVPETPRRSGQRRTGAWVAIAVAVLAAAAVLGAFIAYRSVKSGQLADHPIKQTRLTGNSVENPVDGAALSADGRYLVFSDKSGIHIKTISGGEMKTIPPPAGLPPGPNTWYPVAWFPNGSEFIATSVNGTQGSTWAISLLGGSPQLLREGAWAQSISGDGSQIAFVVEMDFLGGHEIWAMGAQGENARKLLKAPEDAGFFNVSYSPDGKAIAYVIQQGNSMGRVETLDLQAGAVQPIINNSNVRAAFWLPDGRLIYSVARGPGSSDSDLWALEMGRDNKDAGTPRQLTNWPGSKFASFSATADSKQLAFLRLSFESDVFVSDLNPNTNDLSVPQRLTLDDHNDMPTGWTADGKEVIFFSDREGPFNVYRQALGGDARALTNGGGYKWGPRLNNDGSAVVYLESPSDPFFYTGMVQMKKVGPEGGPPQNILNGRNISDHRCARGKHGLCAFDEISEDGKTRTLYTYDEEHGRGRELISYDAIPYSNWDISPDGRVIAISRFDPKQARIRFLSLDGRQIPDLVVKGWAAINALDWMPDGKRLLLSSSNSRGSTLVLVELDGTAKPLMKQGGGGQIWGIPSPDGRRLALAGGMFDSNAWMLQNF
jgi:serine/threonine protein kinase/Tol biopolymer transport system component